MSGNMNIWGWYREVNRRALLELWFTSRYHPQMFMFPDTRHVQGHYWSFGSRLDTILKCSCFQTLGMLKGTTEALVHVSIPSSSVHVSRHLACSRTLLKLWYTSRYHPQMFMFPDTKHVQRHYTCLVSGNMNIWGWYRDVNQSFSSVLEHAQCLETWTLEDGIETWTKASVVPFNMPSVWKHEHLRMVSKREPKRHYWSFGSRLDTILKC
jgi:hypothetical protein